MSGLVLARSVLEQRLEVCRTAKQQRLRQHAQLQAQLTENQAQINALIGRETELEELLALPLGEAGTDGAARHD